MSSESAEYFTPEQGSSESFSTSSSKLPQLTKCVRRPKLNRKMVMNLLARRYGSLHDFSQVVARWCDISRATGVHPNTVRKVVLLYHQRGNRFESRIVRNYAGPRTRVVPPELEAQLTSH